MSSSAPLAGVMIVAEQAARQLVCFNCCIVMLTGCPDSMTMNTNPIHHFDYDIIALIDSANINIHRTKLNVSNEQVAR